MGGAQSKWPGELELSAWDDLSLVYQKPAKIATLLIGIRTCSRNLNHFISIASVALC